MQDNIKFKLTSETKVNIFGVKLFRIEATVDIPEHGVEKGEKGGWVETEEVNGNARVSGDAWVSGDAQVYGNAGVFGNAQVYGNAWVYGDARVFGDARVSGDAQVSGDARVSGNAEVFGDAWVSLKKSYTQGKFLYSSDSTISTTVIDQTKENNFNEREDYKNLLVVGDYEINEIDSVEKTDSSPPKEITIEGATYILKEEICQ